MDRRIGEPVNQPLSDEELMVAVREGDLTAFDELVIRHQDGAWRLARRFLGRDDDAEDLVQEAFLRLLGAAERYEPRAAFRTYFYRILTHLCLDHARRRRPQGVENLPETADESPMPDEILLSRDRERRVHEALALLPPRDRMAVVLRYFAGSSGREMAELMGTSAKGVERLLARARTRLLRELGSGE